MNKSIKKSKEKSKEKWNVAALNALATKYDFSNRYIKQCITGDRTPVFADRIKSEYKTLVKNLEQVLNNNEL